MAAAESNPSLALDKAKEATKRERALTKQREQMAASATSPHDATPSAITAPNLYLTYCVMLNLASCYHQSKMYQESINTYSAIAKNKLFNQSGRLRVNMGNIYFEQQKFSQAIKMYRMALDQIPNTNMEIRYILIPPTIRLKIMRNIGISFVKLGQFQDAITSFENIVEANSDYHAAFNLVICYFALGDRERMKRGFQKLVQIRPLVVEQFDDVMPALDENGDTIEGNVEDHEVFNHDSLRGVARERYT
jgi:intraflagellar transport protein 88